MSPQEFRAIRKSLGLTQAGLAALLGYAHAVRVAEFEAGTGTITPLLERLMRAYAEGYRPAAHADTLSRKAPHDVS